MPRRIPANGPENLEGRKTGMEAGRLIPAGSPAFLFSQFTRCP
jgi:hypothetical protein